MVKKKIHKFQYKTTYECIVFVPLVFLFLIKLSLVAFGVTKKLSFINKRQCFLIFWRTIIKYPQWSVFVSHYLVGFNILNTLRSLIYTTHSILWCNRQTHNVIVRTVRVLDKSFSDVMCRRDNFRFCHTLHHTGND